MKMTIAALLLFLVFLNTSFHNPYSNNDFYVVIDKSDYELHVYDAEGWLITYPVVFGNRDLGDKMMEGDKRTPEGTFRILSKKPHQKWSRFILLDYPNKESFEKFNNRKINGLIPTSAKIGGAIGIHGTWPREDYAIDQYQNWTLGCISLKNEHIHQLYSMLPIGTKITIQR